MGQLPGLLRAGGLAVFEVGAGQADAVAGVAESAALAVLARVRDLSGTERCVVVGAPGNGAEKPMVMKKKVGKGPKPD
jgi:methylase of polypeptide subunit release factors